MISENESQPKLKLSWRSALRKAGYDAGASVGDIKLRRHLHVLDIENIKSLKGHLQSHALPGETNAPDHGRVHAEHGRATVSSAPQFAERADRRRVGTGVEPRSGIRAGA